MPPARYCLLDVMSMQPYCLQSTAQLVTRNTTCHSCFKSYEDLRTRTAVYGYHATKREPMLRLDCAQISKHYLNFGYANQSCDTLLAWPNKSSSTSSACTGSWCAAVAGTLLTGVCHT
jgi:hypothetical protein